MSVLLLSNDEYVQIIEERKRHGEGRPPWRRVYPPHPVILPVIISGRSIEGYSTFQSPRSSSLSTLQTEPIQSVPRSPFISAAALKTSSVCFVWMTGSMYFLHYNNESCIGDPSATLLSPNPWFSLAPNFAKKEYSSSLLVNYRQTCATTSFSSSTSVPASLFHSPQASRPPQSQEFSPPRFDISFLTFDEQLAYIHNTNRVDEVKQFMSSLRYLENPLYYQEKFKALLTKTSSYPDNFCGSAEMNFDLSKALSSALYCNWIEINNISRSNSRCNSSNNTPISTPSRSIRKSQNEGCSDDRQVTKEIPSTSSHSSLTDPSPLDVSGNSDLDFADATDGKGFDSVETPKSHNNISNYPTIAKAHLATSINCLIVPTPLSLPAKHFAVQALSSSPIKLKSIHSSSAALATAIYHTKEVQAIIRKSLGVAKFILIEIGEEYVSASTVIIDAVIDGESPFLRESMVVEPINYKSPSNKLISVESVLPKTPKRVRWTDDPSVLSSALSEKTPTHIPRSSGVQSSTVESPSKPSGAFQSSPDILPISSASIRIESCEGDMSFGFQEFDEQLIVDWIATLVHIAKQSGWQHQGSSSTHYLDGHEGFESWLKVPLHVRQRCLFLFKLYRKACDTNLAQRLSLLGETSVLDDSGSSGAKVGKVLASMDKKRKAETFLSSDMKKRLDACLKSKRILGPGQQQEVIRIMNEQNDDYDRLLILHHCLLLYCGPNLLTLTRLIMQQSFRVFEQLIDQYGEDIIILDGIIVGMGTVGGLRDDGNSAKREEVQIIIASEFDRRLPRSMLQNPSNSSHGDDFMTHEGNQNSNNNNSSQTTIYGLSQNTLDYHRKCLKKVVAMMIIGASKRLVDELNRVGDKSYPNPHLPASSYDAIMMWQESSTDLGLASICHYLKSQFFNSSAQSSSKYCNVAKTNTENCDDVLILPPGSLDFGAEVIAMQSTRSPPIGEVGNLACDEKIAPVPLTIVERGNLSSSLGQIGLCLGYVEKDMMDHLNADVRLQRQLFNALGLEDIVWLNSDENMVVNPVIVDPDSYENDTDVSGLTSSFERSPNSGNGQGMEGYGDKKFVIRDKVHLLLHSKAILENKNDNKESFQQLEVSEIEEVKLNFEGQLDDKNTAKYLPEFSQPTQYLQNAQRLMTVLACDLIHPYYRAEKNKLKSDTSVPSQICWVAQDKHHTHSRLEFPRLFIQSECNGNSLREILPNNTQKCLLGQSKYEIATPDAETNNDKVWIVAFVWKKQELIDEDSGEVVIPLANMYRDPRILGCLSIEHSSKFKDESLHSLPLFCTLQLDRGHLLHVSLEEPFSPLSIDEFLRNENIDKRFEHDVFDVVSARRVALPSVSSQLSSSSSQSAEDDDAATEHSRIIQTWDDFFFHSGTSTSNDKSSNLPNLRSLVKQCLVVVGLIVILCIRNRHRLFPYFNGHAHQKLDSTDILFGSSQKSISSVPPNELAQMIVRTTYAAKVSRHNAHQAFLSVEGVADKHISNDELIRDVEKLKMNKNNILDGDVIAIVGVDGLVQYVSSAKNTQHDEESTVLEVSSGKKVDQTVGSIEISPDSDLSTSDTKEFVDSVALQITNGIPNHPSIEVSETMLNTREITSSSQSVIISSKRHWSLFGTRFRENIKRLFTSIAHHFGRFFQKNPAHSSI